MSNPPHSTAAHDRFGQAMAARLSGGCAELPPEVGERLRAARVQALARRRADAPQPAPALRWAGAPAQSGAGGWWLRLAGALPLLALAAGLVAIHQVRNDQRAQEVAEVDAALLTDDLPPSAYADPGFVQFLRSQR